MNREMLEDRWFKLKVDNFISGIKLTDRPWTRRVHVPWYNQSFMWEQIAPSLARGTKYSEAEVVEYLKDLQSAAKLEALLDEDT
ncbi:hypothetical protein [Vibrio phage PJN101]|nr:hypothetical protein [Vibrio phage PJN101]